MPNFWAQICQAFCERDAKGAKILYMKGIALTFVKQIQTGTDKMNNPVNSTVEMVVEDCLIAPIIEPASAREQQAMQQNRVQVRIHLPKAFDADVSDSDVTFGGKTFHVDSDSVVFMNENTPTRWNRYFRAELVANFVSVGNFLRDGFITEDGENFFVSEHNYYYFAQETVPSI